MSAAAPQRLRCSHKRWTAYDDRDLREMAESGWHPDEIAREMGRTDQAVRHRAKAIGVELRLRQPQWTREEDELLLEDISRLSKALGRTPLAVGNRVYRLFKGLA